MLSEKYEIIRLLGKGASSSVYLIRDKKLNLQRAAKVLEKRQVSAGWGGLEQTQKLLNDSDTEKLLKEEIFLQKELRHPAIPAILDYYEDDETVVIIMEYMEGTVLSDLPELVSGLGEERMLSIAAQVCEVLCYLHHLPRPVIYADLKPSNLVLKPDGSIGMLDFGAAVRVSRWQADGSGWEKSRGEQTGTAGKKRCILYATPAYAAPELYSQEKSPVTCQADIYSMGVFMHVLLTGRFPVRRRTGRGVRPVFSCSPAEKRLIGKCLRQDPRRRWSSSDVLYRKICQMRKQRQSGRRYGILITGIFISGLIGLLFGR